MDEIKYAVRFGSDRLVYRDIVLTGAEGLGIHTGVTAVVGPNGCGKSTLGTIIEKGRHAFGNRLIFGRDDMKVKMLAFSDIHSLTGVLPVHYSQRMEATVNDLVPAVSEIMGDKAKSPLWNSLCQLLGLHDILDKKVNFLSSGELRKLLIINTLLDVPDILILDNPYIGLDAKSRLELDKALTALKSKGFTVVLLLSDMADVPDHTDWLITMDKCSIISSCPYSKMSAPKSIPSEDETILPDTERRHKDHEISFSITNGTLRYGDRKILSGINWTVRRGERWALTGPNGAGKSLLLSLICADHPQAYSNDIRIFDRRRGSGESIWDIKDFVSYVSPEMQLFFRSDLTVQKLVIQGRRNSLNKFRPVTDQDREEADKWLSLLGISHLSQRQFSRLSTGEQRLALIAAALIKQPELLVLDEPFHGLDPAAKSRLRRVIDALALRNGTSLIFVTHYPDELPCSIDKVKTLTKI